MEVTKNYNGGCIVITVTITSDGRGGDSDDHGDRDDRGDGGDDGDGFGSHGNDYQ